MTEDERRDRIVKAAEFYVTTSDPESEGAYWKLREACKPITPPYKPLLSDEKLGVAAAGGPHHDTYSFWRAIGAATLEAMADVLERDIGDVAASQLRERARKEREL